MIPDTSRLSTQTHPAPPLTVRGRTFEWGTRTYLMAIVNVTPDSFSGDGLNDDIAAAAVLARQFEREGADIIDVGAESTRPNADPITPAEETARALPAIRAIRKVVDLPISIDTQHAQVAEAALESGADIVNDINGLRGDPGMASIVASRGCALVAMHNQRGRKPGDVVTNTLSGWKESLRIAEKAGILRDQIIVDPGFGFGWTPEENLQLVQRLDELLISNLPLLLGPSRKSTLGLILDSAVEDRLEGTSATVAIAIAKGVDIVRVHDIAEVRKVAAVADAISRGRWQSP